MDWIIHIKGKLISLPVIIPKQNIIDFTSSGLTHSYDNFTSEKNSYRLQEVYTGKSFGNLHINWENKNYTIQIISIQGKVIQSLTQKF